MSTETTKPTRNTPAKPLPAWADQQTGMIACKHCGGTFAYDPKRYARQTCNDDCWRAWYKGSEARRRQSKRDKINRALRGVRRDKPQFWTRQFAQRAFIGYLRSVALGGDSGAQAILQTIGTIEPRDGQHTSASIAISRITAECMSDVRRALEDRFAGKRIDAPTLRYLVAALHRIADGYAAGGHTCDVREGRDWAKIGGGGHMRVDHTPEDPNDPSVIMRLMDVRAGIQTAWGES